jgi:intracellular sulfur oxidation DsrE/DsrF family protein
MTSDTGRFYYKYLQSEKDKIKKYLRAQANHLLPDFDTKKLAGVEDFLKKKENGNENSAHEAILFGKYIEIRSCEKVAEHFGVPEYHVFKVVRRVKNELKKIVRAV